MPAAAPADHKPRSGPQRAMQKLGLVRDIDLALHLPLRYEDETRLVAIADTRDGDVAQVEGRVIDSRIEQRARRQLQVRIDDGSDELLLRFLHFYPSQQKTLAVGARVRVRGEVRGGFAGREMVHPAFKAVTEDTPLATELTPVYPASAQLPQAYLRKAIGAALGRAPLDEVLPAGTLPPGLPSLREALAHLHHPRPQTRLATLEDRSHPAWQRLAFDELLAQQLSQLQAQRARAALRAPSLAARAGGRHEALLGALPFALTRAQQRACAEIAADLARAQPMHRLLQGDVGSGKTVVAALAALIAIDAGWQCALMAPTEILAEQHFGKLVGWLEPLGVQVAWLTGSHKGKARKAMLASLADGSAQLVVGTHAVIQEGVAFRRLGLAIVDEQHRFGVEQRLALRRKLARQGDAALEPHLLMMSATPIPRTLAMTYYADLDVSTIDELPPGRTPVATRLFAETRRAAVIDRIRDEVARGRQVYWVCPLIEASETLDLQNATEAHAELQTALPDAEVGLLHGRMAAAEKAAVMARFAAGQTALLVATTVIEVGVDVPNASLMVIEHAERFGLSQLHQLRGRVGRGAVASTCVLLYTAPLGAAAKSRLKAMLETQDGFEIARRDLEIRGPGEFMGARQSGDALLRFADLAQDSALLLQARSAAPILLERHPDAAARHVERWLASRAEFMKA
jgi:ATP-dependent DNA helicase RecG